MNEWSNELKKFESLSNLIKEDLPKLNKELEKLIVTTDENMVLVYARRCLEVIITWICEQELKRPRGTEPLQRILDKLNKENTIPENIVISMYEVNSMSTFGAHPKEFDLRQVYPVLSNLETILHWYIKYRGIDVDDKLSAENNNPLEFQPKRHKQKRKSVLYLFAFLVAASAFILLVLTDTIDIGINPDVNSIESLAILPFDNFTGDTNNEYFVAGMHSSLIGNLGQISKLRVTGKTSSNSYKNTTKSIKQIAEELDVDAIIESEVLCAGEDSICLQIKVISAGKDEKQIWSGNYKEDKSQILNFYNQITQKIANEVNINLTKSEEKKLGTDMGSVNPDVLEAYYKGEYNSGLLTKEAGFAAIDYFNEAIDIDPTFAPAYAALSGVWGVLKQMDYVTAEEADPRMGQYLKKAMELDSTIAEVYYNQALKDVWVDFNWKQGRKNFEKALELRPNYAEALGLYSHFLMCMGEMKKAREQMDKALITDPNNPFIKALNAMVLLDEEKYDVCIQYCEPLLNIMPNNPLITIGLLYAYAKTGREKESIAQAKKWLTLTIDAQTAQFLEDEFEKSGFIDALNKTADLMAANADKQFIPVQNIYTFYSMSGNKEQFLHWLERAYIKRDPTMPYITAAPFFKVWPDDPRYRNIVNAMKLNIQD